MAKNNSLDKLNDEMKRIDRREEYKAKKMYEKKPKALRRYERYANMSNEKNSEKTEKDS